MYTAVGIDDLNLYASTLTIDYADIVAARANFHLKDLDVTGFLRRSVLPSYEDPVTMGANAAEPIIAESEPGAFELLVVATETGMDHGKSLSTYIHKYLKLGAHCRNFEIKQACYAGTAALQMAAAWVRSGVAPGKKALVIMTDLPRRHFGELAELSIGPNAVALSVSAEPRLFELETFSGYATREVYDTARPTATTEHIDAALSLASYLDLVELAWDKYRQVAQPSSFHEHIGHMIYHTPVVPLIKQAHQVLLESDGGVVGRDEFRSSFERMVQPSLVYTRQLGNTYSANLYAGLVGLMESLPDLQPGIRIGCFSYGSGACAELYSGYVQETAREVLAVREISDHLSARRKVSFEEYCAAEIRTEQSLTARDFEPDFSTPPGHYADVYCGRKRLVLDKVKDFYRSYRWS